MSRTPSELLFEEFCRTNKVQCARVPEAEYPTPDYELVLSGVRVACEMKQIDPTDEDLEEIRAVFVSHEPAGRLIRPRLSEVVRTLSRQLKSSAAANRPTLAVIYDNSPLKSYTMPDDVVQAMFGESSVRVTFTNSSGETHVSEPYFGGNRRMTPTTNTSVSALAILDGGPIVRPLTLRVYHNPFAMVRLEPRLLETLAVAQPLLPDATIVSML
jgi:hypothetical protein